MTVFLIAGEASGDIHASALVRSIRERHPEARFVGLGGDAMQAENVYLYQDYRKMAYMGFVEVIKHLSDVRRNFRIAQEALLRERPDLLILIDYPSFNLRMAAYCREHLPHTRIFYYIPPKVWAWKKWRVHKIAKLSDAIFGIFPFEPAFYQRYGYRCTYVGNPCVAEIGPAPLPDAPRSGIAILPGSRRGEIKHCLPKMIAAAEEALRRTGSSESIVIAAAPGIEPAFYQSLSKGYPLRLDQTHDLLASSRAAIVNSGTATLEAALLDCPQVPVYHITCPWIAHLRPLLFASPYFTLPNIILQREVVREKIAYKFTVPEVADELTMLLANAAYRHTQSCAYAEIRQLLGDADAALEVAKHT